MAEKQIAPIEVICGPMFCGKTEELIRRLRRAVIARNKVQVFKPIIDDRYVVADFRKRFCLCEGARKSVEDKTAFRIVRFEPLFYERARDVVTHQAARVDDAFDFFPEFRLIFYRCAENIAR